jgi:hypothetical protein
MGGSDDKDNIVAVTGKEHFICHRLLTKIYPKHKGLKYAAWAMTMNGKGQKRAKISARLYERLKKDIQSKSNTHKQRISESLKNAYDTGKRKPWNTGKKMPDWVGKKISNSKKGMTGTNTGIPMSEKQKRKISDTLKGHNVSEHTKQLIREKMTQRPSMTCPHCKKTGKSAMKYYHFDNCKYKEDK